MMEKEKKIRVIITKIGLDAHDRGAIVIANLLREAGMEVIYLGRFQTPETIVRAAMQEEVDIIGLSCMSPNHVLLIPDLIGLLRENNMAHVLVIAGGIIPEPYASQLKEAGVSEVFGAGATSEKIIGYIMQNIRKE
jgi:methylmalonyl-CoA mutase, C-terminal domain